MDNLAARMGRVARQVCSICSDLGAQLLLEREPNTDECVVEGLDRLGRWGIWGVSPRGSVGSAEGHGKGLGV